MWSINDSSLSATSTGALCASTSTPSSTFTRKRSATQLRGVATLKCRFRLEGEVGGFVRRAELQSAIVIVGVFVIHTILL